MERAVSPTELPLDCASLVRAGLPVRAMISEQEAWWFLPSDAEDAAALGEFFMPELDRIFEANPEVLITCWSTPPLPEAWLRSEACALRYVCHLTGSVRHFLPRSFLERGGRVTNWGDIPSTAVAEHALLLALAALRNIKKWPEVFREPCDVTERMERIGGRTLRGRRVGIHGIGRVAESLVKLLAGFGTEIETYSNGAPAERFAQLGVKQAASLHALYAHSEVLFVCEGLSPVTALSVGAAELAALPDDAVLVNVARGGLIDEVALLAEARRGRVRVALDVYSEEPLPKNSPWLEVPGAVLSPHIAGPTTDQYLHCAQVGLENIARYFRGEPLRFEVTKDIFDRAT